MQQKQGLFVLSFNAHIGVFVQRDFPLWSPSREEMQG